ncbi:MAG: TetR family transcriptional regulator [Actinomycetota bacterium]|nr:TetR family transcriptional regulator [Actinomycetota bacterium]MDH4353695.1 TetR family transcriptional regulator [Actinomycetota bacterium]
MDEVKRRGRPNVHSRDDLLEVTRTVAAERGYDGTRLTDVAEASGVPVSSLQHYFGTRDAMVREAVTAGVRDELARVQRATRSIQDPWRRLQRMLRLAISSEDSDRRQGWLVWIEHWRGALRDPELLADSALVQREWRAMFAAVVQDGVDQGVFHPVDSTDDITTELIALIDGLGIPLLLRRGDVTVVRARRLVTRAAQRLLLPSPARG